MRPLGQISWRTTRRICLNFYLDLDHIYIFTFLFVLSFLQRFVMYRHREPTISVENGFLNFIIASRTQKAQLQIHRIKKTIIYEPKRKPERKTTTNHCQQKQNSNLIKRQILHTTSIILQRNTLLMHISQPIYLLKSEHPTQTATRDILLTEELCYRCVSDDEQASDNNTGTCGTDSLSHILLLTSPVDQQQR